MFIKALLKNPMALLLYVLIICACIGVSTCTVVTTIKMIREIK